MQPTIEQETIEHLSPVAARMILAALPDHIRASLNVEPPTLNIP